MINIAAAIALVGIIACESYEKVNGVNDDDDWLGALIVLILLFRIFLP